MQAEGMTAGDIERHAKDIYDPEAPDTAVSRTADKIPPMIKERRGPEEACPGGQSALKNIRSVYANFAFIRNPGYTLICV